MIENMWISRKRPKALVTNIFLVTEPAKFLVIISLNIKAILEHRWLYNSLIENKFKILKLVTIANAKLMDDTLIVQLFHSMPRFHRLLKA